jgi:hypothetical protein
MARSPADMGCPDRPRPSAIYGESPAEDPRHPGLNSHRYQSVQGPGGEPLWESYVENRTPGAWRVFWIYQPEDSITMISIGPHPD